MAELQQTDAPTRVRIRFTKKGEMRFLSHHDMMRFFERSIRRACLPVRMSQGFNPRPRFSIAAALGVGVAAFAEILDIELNEPVSPAVVRKRLEETTIPGIEIVSAEIIARKSGQVIAATYSVTLPEEIEVTQEAVDRLLASDEVFIVRSAKKKATRKLNIRPYILDLILSGRVVTMRLAITSGGAARPEEVIKVLAGGKDIDRYRLDIVRVNLETVSDSQA